MLEPNGGGVCRGWERGLSATRKAPNLVKKSSLTLLCPYASSAFNLLQTPSLISGAAAVSYARASVSLACDWLCGLPTLY